MTAIAATGIEARRQTRLSGSRSHAGSGRELGHARKRWRGGKLGRGGQTEPANASALRGSHGRGLGRSRAGRRRNRLGESATGLGPTSRLSTSISSTAGASNGSAQSAADHTAYDGGERRARGGEPGSRGRTRRARLGPRGRRPQRGVPEIRRSRALPPLPRCGLRSRRQRCLRARFALHLNPIGAVPGAPLSACERRFTCRASALRCAVCGHSCARHCRPWSAPLEPPSRRRADTLRRDGHHRGERRGGTARRRPAARRAPRGAGAALARRHATSSPSPAAISSRSMTAARRRAIEIVDVRHEQSAAFAAEGWAKATREAGVCALTAGPGRHQRDERDRRGAVQPHAAGRARAAARPSRAGAPARFRRSTTCPFVSPLVKSAETVKETAPRRRRHVRRDRRRPRAADRADLPRLPARRRLPGGGLRPAATPATPPATIPPTGVEEAAALLAAAERPAIMAGTGLYWAHGEDELRALAEALGAPTFLNGMGRGCLPADHELCFSRARGQGLKEADVVLVVGVPLDFRLGFGGSVGEESEADLARRRAEHAHREPQARRRAGRPDRADAGRRSARAPRAPTRRARARGSRPWPRRGREARGRARGARRRARPASPDARLPRAERRPRPRRDRDRRRRRLRLLRGPRDRDPPAGLLDGPRPVRLPRRRARPGDRRQARAPRPPGLPAARRRRLRVRRHGVRHPGPPRPARSSA